MKVALDRAGRVMIPKELRDRLSIGPDTLFEIEFDGDGLRLMPVRRHDRTVRVIDGLPLIEPAPGLVHTDADVQRWRDEGQP